VEVRDRKQPHDPFACDLEPPPRPAALRAARAARWCP